MRKRLSLGAFCLAVALLVTNAVGLFVAPARHPLALEGATHKQGLPLISAQEATANLAALEPAQTKEYLQQATAVVASGIRHYWPEQGEYDADAALQFHENWAAALLGWMERGLVAAGAIGEYRFARLERLGYQQILSKGVGYCSQASLALASYLTSVGVDARLVGLDGHVVVAARAGGREYLLDPDYNVVIEGPLEAVEAAPSSVADVYLAAGYPPALALELAVIYGPGGNYVGGPDSYHPRHPTLHWLLLVAKWGVPMIAMLPFLVARMRIAR